MGRELLHRYEVYTKYINSILCQKALCTPSEDVKQTFFSAELVTIEIQSILNGHTANDSDSEKLHQAREVSEKCQCLPACTSIEYEAETSQADYDWRAIYRAYRLNITDDVAE